MTLSSETVCQILAPPQVLPPLEGGNEGKGYPSAGAVSSALGQLTSGIESQLHSTFGSKSGGSGIGTGSGMGVDNSAHGRNTAASVAAAMTKEERMYPRTGGKRLASCFAVTDCLQVRDNTPDALSYIITFTYPLYIFLSSTPSLKEISPFIFPPSPPLSTPYSSASLYSHPTSLILCQVIAGREYMLFDPTGTGNHTPSLLSPAPELTIIRITLLFCFESFSNSSEETRQCIPTLSTTSNTYATPIY